MGHHSASPQGLERPRWSCMMQDIVIIYPSISMRTIVDLPKEQVEPLRTLSKRLNLSRAELVRRAVGEYLQRHRTVPIDAAFGLWKGRNEDGVAYQERLRSQWGQ